MKTFFSSLLIVFATLFAAPAFADDACKNLFNPNALPTFTGDLGYIVGGQPEPISDGFKVTLKTATDTRYNYYVFLPAEEGYVYSCEAPSVGKFAKFDKDRWAFVYSKLGNGGLPVGTVIEFHKVQLERGSTATAYQPYNPLCATCDGTVVVENGESRCIPSIKIATTAYNAARFSSVVTDLNTTIATIRDVVTNTINQTAAIADLQATKQTRPDENCPAGKKCLLVEDNNGKPHWYEIIENICGLPSGYTCLEYVKFNGGQYVDTGIILTQTTNIENVISMQSDCGFDFCTWTGFMPSSSVITPRYGINEHNGKYMLGIDATVSGLSRDANKHILKFVTSGSNQILYDVVDESNVRTLVSTSLSKDDFSSNTLSLYVGARHSSSTPVNFVSGKIYYTYLKQNGNLLYDYIPAKRDSDGAIGFYDNVSQSFKAPSGTLTAGPEM